MIAYSLQSDSNETGKEQMIPPLWFWILKVSCRGIAQCIVLKSFVWNELVYLLPFKGQIEFYSWLSLVYAMSPSLLK